MSTKLKTGLEFKGENGERVIVIRHVKLWDAVYFITDLLLCEALNYETEFKHRYKPTGRINTAITELFKDKYFKELKKDDQD